MREGGREGEKREKKGRKIHQNERGGWVILYKKIKKGIWKNKGRKDTKTFLATS